MQVKGRVSKVLGITTGKGQSNWRKQEVLIEQEGKFPKPVAVSIWGDKIEQFNLKEGMRIEAEVDAESREYNGRWYTELKVFKITGGMNVPEMVDADINQDTNDQLSF